MVQSDCCCKKYKYKYILELIYEAKGQKYTKKKILDEPFESRDNDVHGEIYREQLEREQKQFYLGGCC